MSISTLSNISAKSIYNKILTECPNNIPSFVGIFSNYPNIPKNNSNLTQDTFDQLVLAIEINSENLPKFKKDKVLECMKKLGYNKDYIMNLKNIYINLYRISRENSYEKLIEEMNKNKYIFGERVLRLLKNKTYNNKISKDDRLGNKLKNKLIKILKEKFNYPNPEILFDRYNCNKLQMFDKNKIEEFQNLSEEQKDFCKDIYLSMINNYVINEKIFDNEELKNKFIKLMKILGIQEPEYLNYKCIFSNNINNIKKALNNGLSPNIQNNYSNTPLYKAIKSKYFKQLHELQGISTDLNTQNNEDIIIKLLLENNADPNIQNNKGETALHISILLKSPIETIKLLLENNADPNIQDNEGNTPLYKVVIRDNSEEIIKLLLENNADPNIQDNKGKTPLHEVVAKGGSEDITLQLKLLLENKADPNIQDNDGNTPLNIANKLYNYYDRKEKVELLEAYSTK